MPALVRRVGSFFALPIWLAGFLLAAAVSILAILRHESSTGIAYFTDPPTAHAMINTADGDNGRPLREVGGGWWWVA